MPPSILFVQVVLFQPQIPPNTGNIVRTCAVTSSQLLLVKPLGFSIADRHLKRAGLTYWEGVDVTFTDDLIAYLSSIENRNFYFFSSHAGPSYTEIEYQPDDLLIFGSETKGLPEELWQKWPEKFYTIPMKKNERCLNLASAVSVVVYEGLRQHNFLHL